jgi:hypothetical protein
MEIDLGWIRTASKALSLVALIVVSGCSSAREPYADALQRALTEFPGTDPAPYDAVDGFVEIFTGFSHPQWRERVCARYAEHLYFSDTLTVLHSRRALLDYLGGLHDSNVDVDIEVESIVAHGADVYVRWRMRMGLRAAGRDVNSLTAGITLLRFDDAGRIVLHQDYWDSTEGLYRHLPVVGLLINWIGDRFHGNSMQD